MFFRILKLDLKKKKVMNFLLLLFIILATIFSASGLNNIATVMNGTDYYFEKAGIGDYYIVCSKDNNVPELLGKEESVKSYKSEPCIVTMNNNIKRGDEPLKGGDNIVLQAIENSAIHFFDKDDNEITSVKKGEVYLTGGCIEKSNLSIGDEVTVDIKGLKLNLKVAGKAKDAFLGSDFVGITRVILNKEDYETIFNTMYKDNTAEEKQKKGEEVFYIETDNPNQVEKCLGDVTSCLFKASKDTVKLTYVMDMIIAFIVLVLSVCLVIVALLVLRFTIAFTVNEEYREIGVMKAIGINNKSIRNLYIIKYLSLGIVGSVIGLLLSIPFGNMLIKSSTDNMVLGNSVGITINVIGALLTVLVTVLFARIFTGKVKKASPVEAIRNGQTGERYKAKTIYKLKNSHIKLNLYMAINDILSAPKRFITIIISFFVCLVLVLGIVITTDTMKSKNLITAFFKESDVYFIPGEIDVEGFNSMQSKQVFEDDLKKYENLFDKNGIPCKLCEELMFNYNVTFNGNTYSIRTLQGLNTKADEYVYYEGIAPVKENEVAITDIISKKLGAKIGDKITIDFGNEQRELIVTAYFKSLNNQGEVIRLNENAPSNFDRISSTGYYQIDYKDNPTEEERQNRIEKIKELVKSEDVYDAAGICAKLIGVVETMEAVQYLLLAITIVVVILVTLLIELSFITNEKSQIALLKAIGFKDGHIIKWHTYRFLVATLIAEVLAVILAVPITRLWCTPVFAMMGLDKVNFLINPLHIYLIYPGIVFVATVIIAALASLTTKRIKSSDTANIE